MLKVWGRANSINVQKVIWAVGELGRAQESRDARGAFGGLDTDEFRAMNPNARVPVIDDGGTIVWESQAIVRYLAAKYGAGTLWPEDPGVRSLSDRWMDWTITDLQPSFHGAVFWGFYRTPEPQRNWPSIRQGIARSAILFRLLDRHLADKPFVAGDELTIGDVAGGTLLFRYFELEIDRPAIPHVEAWYDRLKARPAYREHVMVPFDDLRGRLSF
jgi:glutathione S-transferase